MTNGHFIKCCCSDTASLFNISDVKNHTHKLHKNTHSPIIDPASSESNDQAKFNESFVAALIRDLQGVYNANEKMCQFIVEKVSLLLEANHINTDLLKNLSSQEKLEKKWISEGVYIKPKQGHSEVCGNYSYIPSKVLFQFLVQHPETSPWILKPFNTTEVTDSYEDFCHGDCFKASDHPLREKMGENFFHIILYADFIELTNPLGSKAGNKGKVCIFQITLMNFPPWYRSRTKFLFFLACGSKDIALDNSAKEIVLGDFISFLNDLQNGVKLMLPNNKESTFYGSVRVVVGDLQMMYDLHGLKLNFGATGKSGCFICTTPNNKFSDIYNEDVYPYKEDLYFNDASTQILLAHDEKKKDFLQKTLGVRERSFFDNMNGFSITKDTMIDIMHVEFEGICPRMFIYVFQQFYHELKWVPSMQVLSEAFANFKYHPSIQKSDLPKLKNFPKNRPKTHSAMMMNMVLHMPIILEEFIQNEDAPVVKLINLFVRIIQFSLSPIISKIELLDFEQTVKDFLQTANDIMGPQLYVKELQEYSA
jgi:hypothetical protein